MAGVFPGVFPEVFPRVFPPIGGNTHPVGKKHEGNARESLSCRLRRNLLLLPFPQGKELDDGSRVDLVLRLSDRALSGLLPQEKRTRPAKSMEPTIQQ